METNVASLVEPFLKKEQPSTADVKSFQNGYVKDESSSKNSSKEFTIFDVNDLTIELTKEERGKFEESGVVKCVEVCSAFHGGALDYPKSCSKAVAHVVDKWDVCFRKLKKPKALGDINLQDSEQLNSDDEVFAKLTIGSKISKGKVIPEDETDSEEDEFISTINESASKLYAHLNLMIRSLISNGDTSSLLFIMGRYGSHPQQTLDI